MIHKMRLMFALFITGCFHPYHSYLVNDTFNQQCYYLQDKEITVDDRIHWRQGALNIVTSTQFELRSADEGAEEIAREMGIDLKKCSAGGDDIDKESVR